MLLAVMLQVALVTVLALLVGLGFDWISAGYLVLGGGVAIVPNSLFAWRLAIRRIKGLGAGPGSFFVGEFVKVGLVIALMVGAVKIYPGLRWLPFLAGLIVALKAAGFALLWVRDGNALSDEALEIRTTKTSTDRYEE